MEIPDSVRNAWFSRLNIVQAQQVTGGLSSSYVWRLKALSQEYCLKAWPSRTTDFQRLHQLQRQLQLLLDAGIEFVPRSELDAKGNYYLKEGTAYWQVTTWLPGSPDSSECASDEKRINAIRALAQLHQVWRTSGSMQAVSPGVSERLIIFEKVHTSVSKVISDSLPPFNFDSNSGWQADQLGSCTEGNQNIDELSSRTVAHLIRSTPRLISSLRELNEPQELHFVIRDLHAGHVLYTDEMVSGIIDFGAARIDEPMLDLVRLLGSQAPFNRQARYDSLVLYREMSYNDEMSCFGPTRPAVMSRSNFQRRFAILDESSTLLSAYHWLKWLRIEKRIFPLPLNQLLERWAKLLARLDVAEW